MTTIDAHIHLWHYTPAEFDWLSGPLTPLRRDFVPADLIPALAAARVDGTVAVQTRQTLEETHWLLALAAESSRVGNQIRGVVGWAPIASPAFPQILESLLELPRLKGLRHIVQAEPGEFLLREDFNAGIRTLTPTGLAYDLLIRQDQLPQSITLVDRHPNQLFILDHVAKPRIATGLLEPWASQIRTLALRPNVLCKISGLVTEARPSAWSPADLTPYLDVVTEAFTPARLLAASDWPVLLPQINYPGWFHLLRTHFTPFSESEQEAIFGGNAIAAYRLPPE
jgi:L-fuconolactonase